MGSPFASRVTATIELPFDPPHTVTVQKLAGRHLRKAHDEHMTRLFNEMRDRGGPSVVKEALGAWASASAGDAKATEQLAEVQADPLNGYDEYAIVAAGVKSWTYGEVTPAAIEDLDDDAVRFIALEIMRLTKPALFQSGNEREAARKNA